MNEKATPQMNAENAEMVVRNTSVLIAIRARELR
jgi:hypothetical protein